MILYECRKTLDAGGVPTTELEMMRRDIDEIDARLITLIAERFQCTERVGRYKTQASLPAVDSAREAQQMARITELSIASGVNPELVQRIFRLIIDAVVENHKHLGAPG